MERNPLWLLNVVWTDEAFFSVHGDMNTRNSLIWVRSNPRESHSQPLHSPHVTVWYGFTTSFILDLFSFLFFFFFEEPCSVSSRKTCTVTAEQCLTILRDYVVPALQKRHALPVVTFMQDDSPPHIAFEVRTFLYESFTENQVINRGYKIQSFSRSQGLSSTDFCLWGCLKSPVHRVPQPHWWNWKMPFDWPSLPSTPTCYT